MLDREPDEEGFEHRCRYCGRHISKPEIEQDFPEFEGGLEFALHFCSKACSEAYASLTNEDREEFEEVYRAGAT